MKRIAIAVVRTVAASLVAIPLVSACAAPHGTGNPVAPETSISGSIVNMHRLQAELPASRSSGDGTSSRAMGDVRELSQTNLPDVKAQGWYNMQEAAGMDVMTEALETSTCSMPWTSSPS